MSSKNAYAIDKCNIFVSNNRRLTQILICWLIIILFMGGCSFIPYTQYVKNPGRPTATNFPLFNATYVPINSTDFAQPVGGKPTVAQFFYQQPSRTSMSLHASVPITNGYEDSKMTPRAPQKLIQKKVYSDHLISNWSLVPGSGVKVDLKNTTFVHQGNFALAFTPLRDFQKLSFLVNHETTVAYPRDRVIAITFWLNGGDDTIGLEDLIVKVLGSNSFPYWVENDKSVVMDYDISLQETRLYFLGLNRAIPPETWVEVVVTLDNLTHDPEYKYVTGFYIKNDEGFLQTVYIDDIELLMIDDGQPPTIIVPEKNLTPSPTTIKPIMRTPSIYIN